MLGAAAVEEREGVAAGERGFDDGGTEEPGAAEDEDAHGLGGACGGAHREGRSDAEGEACRKGGGGLKELAARGRHGSAPGGGNSGGVSPQTDAVASYRGW
ncbi:MAG: hypothetical protein AMXMBFR77_13270 [Phycisphaerales bacterium]